MRFKITVLVSSIVLALGSVRAQDPHFSQFYANPLYLNPAFAGTSVCPRIVLNYRNQWMNIPGYYNTYSASYDVHKDYLSGGIGLELVVDREANIIQTNSISGMYSYMLTAGPNFSLKMGIEARYFQKKIDWSQLNFGDQIHERYGFVYETNEPTPGTLSKWGPDFSVGLLGYNNSLFVGAAVHHLTKPDQGILAPSHLPRKLTVHVGHTIDVGTTRGKRMRRKITDPTISPNVIYQLQQNLEQLNYGLYLNKYPLIIGAWYRHNFINSDMVAVLIGLRQEMFKVGYSYDLTVSRLGVDTGGSHEISFSWKLPCRPEKKKIKVINCPSF